LVCTFEHPPDRSDPDVALNVGGQGPWVARAVTALGAHAILVLPVGGDTGRAARHLLSDAPHEVRAVETTAAIACYVEERRDGERSCVRDARPGRVGQRELDKLYSAALAAAMDADVCVITGSPWDDHIDNNLLTRLTADLANMQRTVVADLSGDQLLAALAGGVDWLKIAHDEVGRDGDGDNDSDSDGDGDSELWAAAKRLSVEGKGHRSVVISRAEEDPALVLTPEGRYSVGAPSLTTVDARGSGDAMTAALATGLAADLPIEDVLRRATAAGAANAVHKGSATPDPDLVDRLARAVDLRKLDG
jgi:1-phosphofructokinase